MESTQLTSIQPRHQRISCHDVDLLQDCHYCHALKHCALREMLEDCVPSLLVEQSPCITDQLDLKKMRKERVPTRESRLGQRVDLRICILPATRHKLNISERPCCTMPMAIRAVRAQNDRIRTFIFLRRQAWHDGKWLSPSSIVVVVAIVHGIVS